MIYFVIAGLVILIIANVLLIAQVKAIAAYMFKIQRAALRSSNNTQMTGEAIAAFMDYVAAFQGEDMMFNKELRERGSAHLSELAETLREELETV